MVEQQIALSQLRERMRIGRILIALVATGAVIGITIFLIQNIGDVTDESSSSWLQVLATATAAAGALASSTIVLIQSRARLDVAPNGLLRVDTVIELLRRCRPANFDSDETKRRRKINKEIQRVADTIQHVPSALKTTDPVVHIQANARAVSIRQLQQRVATMDGSDRDALIADFREIKKLHDTGRWIDLPEATETAAPLGTSMMVKGLYGVGALACFAGIVAVIANASSIGGSSTIVTLILGTIGFTFATKSGVLSQTVQDAMSTATKFNPAIKPPEEES